MTTNARIRTIADGITAEMIAEQTHIFYEPKTGGATVAFQARESLYIDNAYQPLSGDFDVLQADMADIAVRQFCAPGTIDPVSQADLSKISAAGMSIILKAAYDVLYNERAAAEAAAG